MRWPRGRVDNEADQPRVDRRGLLRLGGRLAAGAVGATAAGAALSPPAGAATGDPMVLGTANTSGPSTSLTSTATSGTLALANSGTGPALAVQGAVTFVRSGQVAIFNPNISVTVTVPGGLKKTSCVLAMAQGEAQLANGNWETGWVKVVSAWLHVPEGTVTIYLNNPPNYAVKVAWFVFG